MLLKLFLAIVLIEYACSGFNNFESLMELRRGRESDASKYVMWGRLIECLVIEALGFYLLICGA